MRIQISNQKTMQIQVAMAIKSKTNQLNMIAAWILHRKFVLVEMIKYDLPGIHIFTTSTNCSGIVIKLTFHFYV